MAETYTSLTARRGDRTLVVRCELPGIPHKVSGIGAGGADGDGSTAYSVDPISIVSSLPANYTAQQKVGYGALLQSVRFSREAIDTLTGATTIGGVTVEFTDTTGVFASRTAVRSRTKLGSLSSTLTRTSTTLAVNSGNTISAGDALFIGREMMVANGTGTSITVTRGAGAAKSRQYKHTASSTEEQHADNIYDGPRIWVGQELNIYFGYDHPDLDETDEIGPLRFIINAPPRRSNKGVWQFTADSALKALDGLCARGAFAGKGALTDVSEQLDLSLLTLAVYPDESADYTQPSRKATNDIVYLLVEDEAIRATVLSSTESITYFRVEERAMFGTRRTNLEPGTEPKVREFYPTDEDLTTPRIGYVAPGSSYGGGIVASSHPLVAFLNLLLSRDGSDADTATFGTDRNVETDGTDNSYDVLPPPWGRGYPADRVDLSAFEAVIEETANVRFRRFRLGHKGDFSLIKWFEKEVAPFIPFSLRFNSSGKLTLVRRHEPFPLDTGTAIGVNEIDDSYHGWTLSSYGALARVSSEFVTTDGVTIPLNGNSTLVRELYPDGTKKLDFPSEGADERAVHVLADALTNAIYGVEFPRAKVTVDLPWSLHNTIAPGTKLTVTDPGMVDDENGAYGVTSQTWMATSVNLLSPTNDKPGIRVEMQRAGIRTCHFGPSGVVSSWAGSPDFDLVIGANDYTDANNSAGPLVDKDIKGFGDDGSQGGAGYSVELWSAAGSRLTDALEVTTIDYATNTLTFGSGFTASGGGGYTPQAGDIVRLARYTTTITAEVAAGTLSEEMDYYAYMGDPDTELISTGTANKEWGY